VKAFQGERCAGFNALEVITDSLTTFVPDGAQLRPAAVKVGKGKGINEIAGDRVATMGDGIGLDMAGRGGVGRAAPGGNAVAQQRAGLGG
jgi:hypothetical protein